MLQAAGRTVRVAGEVSCGAESLDAWPQHAGRWLRPGDTETRLCGDRATFKRQEQEPALSIKSRLFRHETTARRDTAAWQVNKFESS